MGDIKKAVPGFVTFDEAMALDKKTTYDYTMEHLNKVRYQSCIDIGASACLAKAEGCYMWDTDGNKHLDFCSDVGVYTLGINNPWISNNIIKYMQSKPMNMDPLSLHQMAAAFAKNMALVCKGLTRTVVVGGGGMEANETMVKMARIAAYRTKQGKSRILSTLNSFHGKSALTVNIGGKPKWRQFQGPDLPGHTYVPYGDLAAAEAEMKKGDVIAFMAEVIQGEGGVVVPPDDYFPGIRKLCDKYDVYMLLDEVQNGMCRTGYLWAHHYYGDTAVPDAFSFAKGISDGQLPAAGCQAKDSLFMAAYGSQESCFHHTATFQDNQISAAVCLASLQFALENDVPAKVREMGAYIVGEMEKVRAKYPDVIKEIRGRGFMLALRYGQNSKGEYYTIPVCAHMALKHRVHSMFTLNADDICRCYGNYYVTKEDVAWYIKALDDACKTVKAQMG